MFDLFNALFLATSGALQFLSVRKAIRDKSIKGVVWYPTALYLCSDFCSLVIYWQGHFWLSVLGMSIAMTAAAIWVFLAILYGHAE